MSKKITFAVMLLVLTMIMTACSSKIASVAENVMEMSQGGSDGRQVADENNSEGIKSEKTVYTDGKNSLELYKGEDGKYGVIIHEDISDKFYDLTMVDNVITIERNLNKQATIDAEFPYDEKSIITLTFSKSTKGAFTQDSIKYNRSSDYHFYNVQPDKDGNSPNQDHHEVFDATFTKDTTKTETGSK